MITFHVYTPDTRIKDVDYLLEDMDKLKSLLPYMNRKIDGEWVIALFEPSIKEVPEVLDQLNVHEYVNLSIYLERTVAEQLQTERPKIFVAQKSQYEKFLDLIADMKVLIEPKAEKELYFRVGKSKDKLPEYLTTLSESADDGVITLAAVKAEVVDERRMYAAEVLISFLLQDRSRWKKYNTLLSELGKSYAFYALRKCATNLLFDKLRYLRNEDTKIREINKIDTFKITQAYSLFNLMEPEEIDTCMYMLDHRELMKEVLYDSTE